MASRPAPAKPWERAGVAPQAAASALHASSTNTTVTPSSAAGAFSSGAANTGTSSGSAEAPSLPDRPATMATGSTYGPNTYGNPSRYGTAAGYGTNAAPYGSSYSRLGSYGSSYGSSYGMGSYGSYGMGSMGSMGGMGMGGYGLGMGGYGMGGYGMGGYGMGAPGMMGSDGASLTQRMESGTAATFQVIQSIVGAFGGFAQMLESTFMATHSSFFAMIGVAEQFGHIRFPCDHCSNYLGQVLSIFALIRWVRSFVDRLLGRAARPEGLNAEGFRAFEATTGGVNGTATAGPSTPKFSKKPLIVFLLTVVGLPWLMAKVVRMITARQEEEVRLRALNPRALPPLLDQYGRPLPDQPLAPGGPLDPSSLTFVRATFPYNALNGEELSFGENDIIAVLTPEAERATAGWWQGRLRDGTIGFFPSNYVTSLPLKGQNSVDAKTRAIESGDDRPGAPSAATGS
ncbi:BQ5605_C018g08737 [Microbotryum silenes-dioicae]|uniref:Peroxisomal membrane protein PEX13 n=1 Tax=Microbotryum silenes-dioicae TaxID=796604 RepID=A0A2X0M1G1_9BASI|nr:BQ5605_C018g08737 [Microbotryum silenes-dioicae]